MLAIRRSKFPSVPLMLLISAFLVLDISLVFLNVHLTRRLEHDASIINITGRQRMLSQKIAKNLLIVSNGVTDADKVSAELFQASDLFESTLRTLTFGGQIQDSSGAIITIEAIRDPLSQQYIRNALALWLPFKLQVELINQGGDIDRAMVKHLAAVPSNNLLALMNHLTSRREEISHGNSASLRYAQILVFLLVLVNFFFIVYRFNRASQNQMHSREQLRALVMQLTEGVFLIDANQNILIANRSAAKICRFSLERLAGMPIQRALAPALMNQTANRSRRNYRVKSARISNIASAMWMVTLMDVTDQVTLKQQSTTDPLTGLLNRIGLADRHLQYCKNNAELCCLFLDLDGFKKVNDQFGHTVGDLALHIVGKRFKSCLKKTDTIARIGGDEFVILVEANHHSLALNELILRLEHSLEKPLKINEHLCHLGVSIGKTFRSSNAISLEKMIQEADQAMYLVKKGKNIARV